MMPTDYNQADVSFVRMMIPHHQAAVAAASKVYHSGSNTQIKALALKIWSAQKAEIETLKKWLSDRSLSAGEGMR